MKKGTATVPFLLCIMNIPAEIRQFFCSGIVQQVVILDLGKIKISVIRLFFLVSAKNALYLCQCP